MLLYESTFKKGGAKTENQGSPYLSYNSFAPLFQKWIRVYAGNPDSPASRGSQTNNTAQSP